jgi:recombination protein RecT
MTNQLAVKDYIKQDQIVQNFRDVLGNHQANAYISSVLIAVANSQALQECTPVSVVSSALRAATLRLSCDPGTGQAYLVPFKGRCTLVIGYRGLMDMALRTGKYRYLNVGKIYEGEEIIEDRLTGMHSLAGGKKSNTVIGYLLYFELMSGYRKSVYMTVEEIAAHAARYSKSLDSGPWKTHREQMEKKTILRMGLGKWGYFDPHDQAMITQLEQSEEIVDAEIVEPSPAVIPPEPEEPRDEAQIMLELGY